MKLKNKQINFIDVKICVVIKCLFNYIKTINKIRVFWVVLFLLKSINNKRLF